MSNGQDIGTLLIAGLIKKSYKMNEYFFFHDLEGLGEI